MMELLRVTKGISKAVAVIILAAAFVCLYKVQNDEAAIGSNDEYAMNYHAKMEAALDNAERLLNYSLFSDKQSFFYLNTMKYSQDINKIIDVQVKPANTAAIEKLMEYSFVPILFALMMVIVCIQYLLESQNGMKKIVRAAADGRGFLAIKRIGIMAAVCVVLSIVMNFVILGILLLLYGGTWDLIHPIQSVPIFSLFPYKMSILQFFYWYCLFFAVAMFAVGQLIYLIMQSTGMSKLSYVLILFIFALEYILYATIPASSRWCFFKYVNLSYLLMPGMALLYENWGNSSFVTDIYTSTTLMALALTPVLMAANTFLYIFKGESRESKLLQRVQKLFQKILAKMNSLFLEMHKMLFLQFGIVIIAVFVILLQDMKIMRGVEPSGYNYYLDTFYKRFSGVAPGGETDAYIEALKAEKLERQNKGQSEEILEDMQSAISTLEFQSRYLLQVRNEKGMDARFLNMRVYNDVFGKRLYKNQENINLLCIVGIILCVGGSFAYERRHSTVSLFNACKNRAKVTVNKTAVMAVIVFIIWALSFALNWMNILDIYNLENTELPIQSLYQFRDFGLRVNIWGYIVFCQLFRLVWLLLIGAVVLVISVAFDYAASIVMSLIMLLPHLLYILKFEALKAVSPVILLDYTRISCEDNANPVFNITYFILCILVILEGCLVKRRRTQGYLKLW